MAPRRHTSAPRRIVRKAVGRDYYLLLASVLHAASTRFGLSFLGGKSARAEPYSSWGASGSRTTRSASRRRSLTAHREPSTALMEESRRRRRDAHPQRVRRHGRRERTTRGRCVRRRRHGGGRRRRRRQRRCSGRVRGRSIDAGRAARAHEELVVCLRAVRAASSSTRWRTSQKAAWARFAERHSLSADEWIQRARDLDDPSVLMTATHHTPARVQALARAHSHQTQRERRGGLQNTRKRPAPSPSGTPPDRWEGSSTRARAGRRHRRY